MTATLTVRLPVQYDNSSEPVAYISFDAFESDGNAEPTNRVLRRTGGRKCRRMGRKCRRKCRRMGSKC